MPDGHFKLGTDATRPLDHTMYPKRHHATAGRSHKRVPVARNNRSMFNRVTQTLKAFFEKLFRSTPRPTTVATDMNAAFAHLPSSERFSFDHNPQVSDDISRHSRSSYSSGRNSESTPSDDASDRYWLLEQYLPREFGNNFSRELAQLK